MVSIDSLVLTNCRLCYNNPGEFPLNTNSDLIKNIYDCLQINVDDEQRNHLPQSICHSCNYHISEFSRFKKHIKDTDEILRQNLEKKAQQSEIETRLNSPKHIAEIWTDNTLMRNEKSKEKKTLFLCVTCGKGFHTRNLLVCHEKIHLKVKPYKCSKCNEKFSSRSNLVVHERGRHQNVRFPCGECPKIFIHKCSLDRHKKTHGGLKEFQCEKCPSAFYTLKELVKHSKYHEGLRLHKCDQCLKSFFERHHLLAHQRSHSGEKPYICHYPSCGKKYAEGQKLKRHQRAKHSSY